MSMQIDTAPPPAPSVRALVEALEPGHSLVAPDTSLRVLRVTVSRVKRDFPDRLYRSAEAPDGNRVWRLR